MKPQMVLMLIVLLATPPRAMALDANKVAYVGGTVLSLNTAHGPIEGRLHLGANELVFAADTGLRSTARLRIDYRSVRGLEFGQRQDRQLPLVVAATTLLGPVGLVSLSAKRRAHYLTVVYVDDLGTYQVGVLELGKRVVRATLDTLESRSGIEVEYQDQAARKWRR